MLVGVVPPVGVTLIETVSPAETEIVPEADPDVPPDVGLTVSVGEGVDPLTLSS